MVSEAFGVRFEERNSSFLGGDYDCIKVPEGEIRVQSNLDIDEPFEDNWPADQFLLEFDGLKDEAWGHYTQLLARLSRFTPRIHFFRGLQRDKFFTANPGVGENGCSADLPPLQPC